MGKNYLFTSESVSEGHPDKVSDQISDAILDAVLTEDPMGRVACETFVSTGLVIIGGEITTNAYIPFEEIARQTIRNIGYTDNRIGFDADNCSVLTCIGKQSQDISQGVSEGTGLHVEQGAGDQGMMFGYACTETEELMPMPIILAHKLLLELARIRREGSIPYIKPDSKSQVTVQYENGEPKRIHIVVVSTQHSADVEHNQIEADLTEKLIKKVLPSDFLDDKTIIHINPTGRFVIGGPHGDTGLTGRKIIVDTYGGMGRHGGGAFSGKDPTKVDRSASYMARYIAKNIVAAGLAKRCEVQFAYAIGVAEPVSINVDTFGQGLISDEQLSELVRKHFNTTPKGIIETLNLRRPIYTKTAAYGHFGRSDEDFTWEKTDMAEVLRNEAGI